jgi:hypothetical protein
MVRIGIVFLASVLLLSLSACEKDIDIKLNETEPKLVVDGQIEAGQSPRIVLTQSLDYFGIIDPSILRSSFVREADLTILSDGQTFTLVEDSLAVGANKLYYFTLPSLKGQVNKSYTLTIRTGGETYTATTTIPALNRRIDSVWSEPAKVDGDSVSYARLMMKVTDAPGLGDYIRYFTRRNNEPFYPGFNSVFDDQVVDGKTYTVNIPRGVNKNEPLEEKDLFFKKGDVVILKLSQIDKTTYDFWRTFEFNFQSIGNPFSSPIKVLGNVSNGALGYFGGYAPQFRSLTIPK